VRPSLNVIQCVALVEDSDMIFGWVSNIGWI